MRELVACLRRSKALLSLDLSGNPGINDELRTSLAGRIRCKPDPLDLQRLVYIQAYVNDLNKGYDEKNQKNEKILESMQVRGIREVTMASQTNKLTKVRTYQENEALLYQRILGHKNDIPGSGQWVETSTFTTPPDLLTDWVTAKSIYTLVFWSKGLARQVELDCLYSAKETELLAKLLKKPDLPAILKLQAEMPRKGKPLPYMEDQEVKISEQVHTTPPLLAGSLNNWQYAPMYRIEDFVAMMDKLYEDPLTPEYPTEAQDSEYERK